MPEYLSPGVYVEEVDAGPKPIEGVSTSTTGMVGVTERGPSGGSAPGDTTNRGKPVLVTSFADFTRVFGGFLPEPPPNIVNRWALDPTEGGRWWLFPLSVKGFFDNGGQRLFVKRVFPAGATAAAALQGIGLTSEVVHDAGAADTSLRIQHLFGIQNNSAVHIVAGGNPIGAAAAAPLGTVFHVRGYDATTGTISLDQPIGQDLKAGRDFVVIFARQAPAPPQPGPPPVPDTRTLTFTAKSVGDWGGNTQGDYPLNGIRVRMRPMVGGTFRILGDPATGGNAAQTSLTADAAANAAALTVGSVAGFGNGDHVLIRGHQFSINGAPAASAITIQPVAGAPAQATVDTAANNGAVRANNVVTIKTTAAHTFAAGDMVVIAGVADASFNGTVSVATVPDNTHFTYAQAGAAATSGTGTATQFWHAAWQAGTPVLRLRPANNPGSPNSIHVQNAEQLYLNALVELDNGTNKERFTVDSVVGDLVTLSQNLANQYLEGNRMRVIEAEVLTRYEVDGVVQAEEHFQNLHLADDGTMNFLVTQINSNSQLVDVVTMPGFSDSNLADFPAVPPPAAGQPDVLWQRLDGGDNHLELLTVDDFVGVDGGSGARTGIQAMEDIDEISICAAPSIWSTTVQSALITHCEQLRYRFVILDPKDGLSIDGIQTFREPIDTKYAALYYPWIEVRDPSVRRNVQIGPSGHMAGIYARVDVERGVFKAPANEVIDSITKISQDVNKREQDLLNPKNINALRFFPNRGNRVWGARVLTSDSSWKYINVRRLFIYVEASIDYGTQWVVFEPNDEPLWARVRQSISNFLTSTWRSGALQGAKPDEAFFVKCDHTTMTQDDIDNGRLICVIGIAPVKPAEFVIFRIQQKTMEIQAS